MGRLRILASGKTKQAQAEARGKLFEELMTKVLRHYGYQIDAIPSVNYAGMEIDIEGKAIITNIPIYAECKCYETDVTSPKLQEFFGKYMTRWLRNKYCQGLFIALPGVNSHAKGFYRDNCEQNQEISVRLIEEEQVLTAMYETDLVSRPKAFMDAIPANVGTPGDTLILYTDQGCFVIQFVIPPGVGVPNSIALFDGIGNPITSSETVDYLTQLYPELGEFLVILIGSEIGIEDATTKQDSEQIVEVRGSSSCFEYQFPASPEYFIGREAVLCELDSFVTEVVQRTTSSRGIVFEANSGWGKSSVVLASVARLRNAGHFAVAIDSRTASTSQFILQAVDYALNTPHGTNGLPAQEESSNVITGFNGVVDALAIVGKALEGQGKVLFIFLDQFENLFFLTDALSRIRDLFVKVVDAQTNIVFGFSWKTDLVGLTNEFPYQIRDTVTGSSRRVGLDTFSDIETNMLLDRLSEDLHAPLRKDLRFFLSEFSQGFPWLLKKLCAHVKSQREAGVHQRNIAESLLNVEELFQGDLRGLSVEQDDSLRRIAKVAPVSVAELGEEFKPEVVQSLVDARLLVRVGPKYDVYWDIFRDYLNVGKLPVQDNYILHIPATTMFRHTKLVADKEGKLNTSEFKERTQLADKSFYNLVREMRVLGLAKVEDDIVTLQINLPAEEKSFEEYFREHVRERLRRNRLVSHILDMLEAQGSLAINEVSGLLAEQCPYISASKSTWNLYARVFAEWMDTADLATYNKKEAIIDYYSPGTQLRDRNLLQGRSRAGIVVPTIQYGAIEDVAVKLVEAINGNGKLDWTGIKGSTRTKALEALEELGFIVRKSGRISVSRDLREFVENPSQRTLMFASRALNVTSFGAFVEILERHQLDGLPPSELGLELRRVLGTDWKESTSVANAKVMLNWARNAGMAPGAFKHRWKKVVAN